MKSFSAALVLVLVTSAVAQQRRAAVAVPHGISFSWVDNDPTVVWTNLYCGTAAGQEPPLGSPTVVGIKVNPYKWTKGNPGTTYFCTVTAVNAIGEESAFSNEATATFPAPPLSPTGLAGVAK